MTREEKETYILQNLGAIIPPEAQELVKNVIRIAIAEERERCAKAASSFLCLCDTCTSSPEAHCECNGFEIAAAIREGK